MGIQHYFPEKFWGQVCVCGKLADSAQRKGRAVSLNSQKDTNNFLLISLPQIVVEAFLRSIPEVSDEWEFHWFGMHRKKSAG